jgi:hypothetical protein
LAAVWVQALVEVWVVALAAGLEQAWAAVSGQMLGQVWVVVSATVSVVE